MTEASWLGRRDDRARLIGLGLLAAGLASLQRLEWVGAGLGVGALLCLSTRVAPRALARGLGPLLALLVPLWLLTPFYAPPGSTPLWPTWAWGPTHAGLRETGLVSGRVLAVALVVIPGLAAAPFDRTIHALQRLWVPAALVHVTLLTYRYLFDLRADAARMRQALAARAFRPRPTPATARVLATVTGSLLVRSLARTERVEQAMRCRGYAGRFVLPPTSSGGLADLGWVAASAAVAVGLVVADRGWA